MVQQLLGEFTSLGNTVTDFILSFPVLTLLLAPFYSFFLFSFFLYVLYMCFVVEVNIYVSYQLYVPCETLQSSLEFFSFL
jgi:hypothetical protein